MYGNAMATPFSNPQLDARGAPTLRPLALHLHELALFCDQLDNVRIGKPKSGDAPIPSTTKGIAKWLTLCGEVEAVQIDTGKFQRAQEYCAPIADKLGSDAVHRGSLALLITKFVFFCNALEEAYRFSEHTYDRLRKEGRLGVSAEKPPKTASMKASALIYELSHAHQLPLGFSWLVERFDALSMRYEAGIKVPLKIYGFDQADVRHGLDLVRCLRNHVAHGIFPIVDNPRYSEQVSDELQKDLVDFLREAIRVGTLYIQLLLSVDNDGRSVSAHTTYFTGDETGTEYVPASWGAYLLSLHCEQSFGLNEASYFDWYMATQEARDADAEALDLDAGLERD